MFAADAGKINSDAGKINGDAGNIAAVGGKQEKDIEIVCRARCF